MTCAPTTRPRSTTRCKAARRVWCAFVFDTDILDPLPRADRRVEFIHASLADLDRQLGALGQAHGAKVHVIVRHGRAVDEIPRLAQALPVQAVYANHDDDPAALERDARVRGALAESGVALHTSKDHVVFERSELLTGGGLPYSVFTPYKNAWLKKVEPFFLSAYPVERYAESLTDVPAEIGGALPALRRARLRAHQPAGAEDPHRQQGRARPAGRLHAPHRRLRPHARLPGRQGSELPVGAPALRHGLDPRSSRAPPGSAPARRARGIGGAATWLSELVWRDFYHQILHHHPHVVGSSFKPAYDKIRWEHGKHADALFAAWCEGRTGYPLVDAAMAQINQTGYMHNRLRMVVASFLTKDLGIDWRRGEAISPSS